MPTFQKYVNKKKIKKENFNSFELSKKGVCLPSGNDLNYNDQKYVVKVLKKVLASL